MLTTILNYNIYFKLFNIPNSSTNNDLLFARYGHFGGAINNLDYMLNGGSVNSLIRIPDLSSYFRAQLDIAKQKLKNKSKSLSVSSENEILQIIEALEKHEKNLKEQFELLKNAHLIDEKVVSLREDKTKLEKAKSSLRKYMKYNNGLYDIVRNILEITEEIKGKSLPAKPAFES